MLVVITAVSRTGPLLVSDDVAVMTVMFGGSATWPGGMVSATSMGVLAPGPSAVLLGSNATGQPREALQVLIDHTQSVVNGFVRVKLYKGNVIVVGRDSKTDSLFDPTIATFEDDAGAYDQKDAAGFIKLNALRMRIAANLRARKGQA